MGRRAWVALWVLGLVGCGEATGPEAPDVEGVWDVTRAVASNPAKPGETFDLLTAGFELVLTVGAGGQVELRIAQGGVVDVEMGTIAFEGGTVTLTLEGDPSRGPWSLDGDRLTIELRTGVEWDFDGDDLDEPATLDLELLRRSATGFVYAVPETVGDGWETGHLADVGLDEARLTRLVDLIEEGVYPRVHGLVIVKDGRLVFEAYFPGLAFEGATADTVLGTWTGFDRTTAHNLASVTKTITSTLLGIALGEERVPGLDMPVYDAFPELADLRTPERDAIRLEHLLTMSAGLAWDEHTHPYGDPRNDISALFTSDDPLRRILSKAVVASPGESWVYSGGSTIVLGEVVARATGTSLDAYADERLLAPLGITDREWVHLQGGVTYASGDLRMRPRDMAKIGQLFVDGGRWDGRQVVPEDWVDEALRPRIPTWAPAWEYGYQWWTRTVEVDGVEFALATARGWGGQQIAVVPELDLVVVQTGGNYLTSDPADAILTQFVLPALEG